MKTGSEMIADERRRQIDVKGYTAQHDDEITDGNLAKMAEELVGSNLWWNTDGQRSGRIRTLVVAGALLAAEIDRIGRLGQIP